MTRIGWSTAFCCALALAKDYEIHDYGRDCMEAMGTEVPKIDCLSPKATVLKVTVDGKEVPEGTYVKECDRPANISQAGHPCAPGARLLKFETENKKGEKVTTVAICRRYRNRATISPIFDDIGVIQHNEKTNATCWFARTDSSGTGWDSRTLPPPYVPGSPKNGRADTAAKSFWSSPKQIADGQCIRCHAASLWIRTPFVAQAKRDKKHDNTVPDNVNHDDLHHVGEPFKVWNENPPSRIRIDHRAYDKLFPPTAAEKKMAPVDRCTECHAIGQHKWESSSACNYLVGNSMKGHSPVAASAEFHKAWMPPANKFKGTGDAARFATYYSRAIKALERCCKDPELTADVDGKKVKVCKAPPPVAGAGKSTAAEAGTHGRK